MRWYFIGVDLGQSEDYTALAVVERRETAGEFDGALWAHRRVETLWLRHLERVQLGTSYPDVVERLVRVAQTEPLAGQCTMVVDATGVGRPVVDQLKAAKPGCSILPVLILGVEWESQDRGCYRVPKKDLVTGLELLLENEHLAVAQGLRQWPALKEEMMEMKVRKTEGGREQFGVTRAGQHDDLVLATALACWAARKVTPSVCGGDAGHMVREDEGEWRRRFQWAIDAAMRRVGR